MTPCTERSFPSRCCLALAVAAVGTTGCDGGAASEDDGVWAAWPHGEVVAISGEGSNLTWAAKACDGTGYAVGRAEAGTITTLSEHCDAEPPWAVRAEGDRIYMAGPSGLLRVASGDVGPTAIYPRLADRSQLAHADGRLFAPSPDGLVGVELATSAVTVDDVGPLAGGLVASVDTLFTVSEKYVRSRPIAVQPADDGWLVVAPAPQPLEVLLYDGSRVGWLAGGQMSRTVPRDRDVEPIAVEQLPTLEATETVVAAAAHSGRWALLSTYDEGYHVWFFEDGQSEWTLVLDGQPSVSQPRLTMSESTLWVTDERGLWEYELRASL